MHLAIQPAPIEEDIVLFFFEIVGGRVLVLIGTETCWLSASRSEYDLASQNGRPSCRIYTVYKLIPPRLDS
jgi:hypothetical protein